MAITQTGSFLRFTPGTANTGTVSSTITVPADAEMVIVGVSGYRGATASYFTGGSMTFTKGGVDTTMSAVTGGDSDNTWYMAAIFYLVLPDTGANKALKWNWAGSGTATNAPLISVGFWKGINTSTTVRSGNGAQAASLPYTTPTLTAQSGDMILAWVGGYTAGSEGTINSWSNLTELSEIQIYGNGDGAWATGNPTGNTTVAASTGTNFEDGGICAMVLIPASAAPSTSLVPPNISRRMSHLLGR